MLDLRGHALYQHKKMLDLLDLCDFGEGLVVVGVYGTRGGGEDGMRGHGSSPFHTELEWVLILYNTVRDQS